MIGKSQAEKTAFAFDNFRVASRSTHAEHSATYAYNSVNQMTSLTVCGTGNPVTALYTYFAHVHLGTSQYGFDPSRIQVSQHEHLPYGQRFITSGPAPYHEFTGKPWDPDAQLFYFPYRHYSPVLTRWTTPDPAGLVDGPNVYAYVKGNIINSFDVYGLWLSDATCDYLHDVCALAVGAAVPTCFHLCKLIPYPPTRLLCLAGCLAGGGIGLGVCRLFHKLCICIFTCRKEDSCDGKTPDRPDWPHYPWP